MALPPRRRILVVEDEPGIADTIRYALETDGFEPVLCALGGEALARFEAEAIDLVVLDVGLPDMNGFELFRVLQAKRAVPVIFVTARADEVDRVVGLELGADDYIAKPFSPRELVARVRTVLRRATAAPVPQAGGPGGGNAPGGGLARAPAYTLDEARRRITYHGQPLELTRYEYGLLKLLLSRPGRVYSRDELLTAVWGDSTESLDRTVDAHVKTLRMKLRAIRPDADPIVTHRGAGYALAEP